MTPAIKIIKSANVSYILHEYDSTSRSYGVEASHKLGVTEERVFKTIVVALVTKELVVGIIPVSSRLNMKLLAKIFAVKKASMAEASDVERSTGYVLGGVSPLGQKKMLKTIIDVSAKQYPTIYISGGRRGLEIELKAECLKTLTLGRFAEICQ